MATTAGEEKNVLWSFPCGNDHSTQIAMQYCSKNETSISIYITVHTLRKLGSNIQMPRTSTAHLYENTDTALCSDVNGHRDIIANFCNWTSKAQLWGTHKQDS